MSAYVAVKSNHVRMFRGTAVTYARSSVTRVIWAAICILVWTSSYIIETIPILKDVLGLAVRLRLVFSGRSNCLLTGFAELPACEVVLRWFTGNAVALYQSSSLDSEQK